MPPTKPGLTTTEWLICVIASIGFAFDIYEILVLPLIARPAILELTGAVQGSPEYQMWVGRLFYIPAFAGGVFGLLGGYLTDLFGRRRVLTYSILLYAFGAFFSGFVTSIQWLLVFRCLVFIGVCVEFVAAVAWLAEIFTDPKRREKVLGYTQAFSSVGGLLVAVANGLAVTYAASLPALDTFTIGGGAVADPHAPWRYTLMSGVLPAIPLILIRPFLPESPTWQRKRAAGTLKRPSIAALFAPDLRRTTLVTTLMFAMSYGAAFGAIQQIPQIVPGLEEVREQTAGLAPPAARRAEQSISANVVKVQELGGLAGRIALAILAIYIVSRRKLIRVFQIPGLILMPLAFWWAAGTNVAWLSTGIFLVAFMTVAQFSFWGNYLPRVYPLHLRGTGESFAANIGGRMIGTSFAWLTASLAITADRANAPARVALVAGAVGLSVYIVGFIASFWLPEPTTQELPE
ncbi:MAG: MFS transporter [Vicinamibacterales bacterium]